MLKKVSDCEIDVLFEAEYCIVCWAMLFSVIYPFFIPQDVMFRESKRPRGDPEVLAAQSREQYYKVLLYNRWCSSMFSWYPVGTLSYSLWILSLFFSWRTDCKYSHWESVASVWFQPIFHILLKLQQGTYIALLAMICGWYMFGFSTYEPTASELFSFANGVLWK